MAFDGQSLQQQVAALAAEKKNIQAGVCCKFLPFTLNSCSSVLILRVL